MNTKTILIALLLPIFPALAILPGGCIITHLPDEMQVKKQSISLNGHHIIVKAGQEFSVTYNFGKGSHADAWGIINMPHEIELINCYQLESFPPITVWAFKSNFAGDYALYFQNKLSKDIISVYVKVI